MRVWGAWVVTMAGLVPGPNAWAAPPSPQIGSIDQHSEGECSPPIVDNQGQVTISCEAVDKKALRYLENQLSEQFRRLSEQVHSLDDSSRTIRNLNDLNENLRQQADDWARRFHELSARLAASQDDSLQAKQAHELIQQGEFDKAEPILRTLAAKEEDDVTRAAATQHDLGEVAMLRFDPGAGLPHYEKAFRYRPDNPHYADDYARAADRERRYAEAEMGWDAALQSYRELAGSDPDAYRPDVADMLNYLGNLYRNTGRLEKAEKAYNEALAIRRDLAARNPTAHRRGMAATLNNLGIFYSNTGRPSEAEKVYNEALAIRRDLAAQDPRTHQPNVAATLDNLGRLYWSIGRLGEAENAYSEALGIRRELAARNPGAYRPDVGTALSRQRACGKNGALGLIRSHAAATASNHCAAASALKIRNVDRETRWRWRLKVL